MIRSDILRKSAGHDEARCMFEIAGICCWLETRAQCLCHIPVAGEFSMGLKTDDTSAAFGCATCHDAIDGRRGGLRKGSEDWLFYTARAHRRQIAWWIEHEFLTIGRAA